MSQPYQTGHPLKLCVPNQTGGNWTQQVWRSPIGPSPPRRLNFVLGDGGHNAALETVAEQPFSDEYERGYRTSLQEQQQQQQQQQEYVSSYDQHEQQRRLKYAKAAASAAGQSEDHSLPLEGSRIGSRPDGGAPTDPEHAASAEHPPFAKSSFFSGPGSAAVQRRLPHPAPTSPDGRQPRIQKLPLSGLGSEVQHENNFASKASLAASPLADSQCHVRAIPLRSASTEEVSRKQVCACACVCVRKLL